MFLVLKLLKSEVLETCSKKSYYREILSVTEHGGKQLKKASAHSKYLWQGIFPATVFSFCFLKVWCRDRVYRSLFNLSRDEVHFLHMFFFVVRLFRFTQAKMVYGASESKNVGWLQRVSPRLMLAVLGKDNYWNKWWREIKKKEKKKNILSRPKRLRKILANRNENKKTQEKRFSFIWTLKVKHIP